MGHVWIFQPCNNPNTNLKNNTKMGHWAPNQASAMAIPVLWPEPCRRWVNWREEAPSWSCESKGFGVEVCTGSKLKPEPGPYPRLSDTTRPDPTRAAQLNLEPEPDPKSPPPTTNSRYFWPWLYIYIYIYIYIYSVYVSLSTFCLHTFIYIFQLYR